MKNLMRLFEKMLLPVGGLGILVVLGVGIWYTFFHVSSVAPLVPLTDDGAPDVEVLTNIRIAEPKVGDVIGLPLVITGQARVFENVFQYRVKDDVGNLLAQGHAIAEAPDVGEYGSFTLSLSYLAPLVSTGVVEVFSYSARDGAEQDLVSVPVSFSSDVSSRDVQLYFVRRDVTGDCGHVEAVTRRIASTPAIGYATVSELLQNAAPFEDTRLFSLIPPQAQLRSLVLEDGVATVTFVRDSFLGVAGSCMVQGIRAQIEATLRQFSSIQTVVILEEGKTAEETLQP